MASNDPDTCVPGKAGRDVNQTYMNGCEGVHSSIHPEGSRKTAMHAQTTLSHPCISQLGSKPLVWKWWAVATFISIVLWTVVIVAWV